ncbi:hypothetical protein ABXK61_13030 [Burkholderia sola]|uniref:hypothetical protein n=1 Tax=Burkholderia TaxID=32008 RepID=UPI001AE7A8EC|nr:hypothetical protein [Burkholderia sp. AcTa6-5]MBP0714235.1 hypothetical protein [Burkholderia sp. AcTa6-5]
MNFLDVDLDSDIYRITTARYFLEDVRMHRFTVIRINGRQWGDPTENPLLNATYRTAAGEDLTLGALTRDFFASCWSLRALGKPDDWEAFAHGEPGIRIQTTPRKLVNGFLYQASDTFASLKHWMGRVQYLPLDVIDEHFEDPNWGKHLDPTNEALIRSVLKIRQNWKTEEEVRLVFDRMQNDAWNDEHAPLEPSNSAATRSSLPFDWSQADVELYPDPSLSESEFNLIRTSLQRLRRS